MNAQRAVDRRSGRPNVPSRRTSAADKRRSETVARTTTGPLVAPSGQESEGDSSPSVVDDPASCLTPMRRRPSEINRMETRAIDGFRSRVHIARWTGIPGEPPHRRIRSRAPRPRNGGVENAQRRHRLDAGAGPGREPVAMRAWRTRRFPDEDRYRASMVKAKEHVRAGDVFQIVLSQRAQRRTDASAVAIYRSLPDQPSLAIVKRFLGSNPPAGVAFRRIRRDDRGP